MAIALLRACSVGQFVETVEFVMNLNLDPKKPNQSVRGIVALPAGTGQQAE